METTQSTAITLTKKAEEKVREILAEQDEEFAGLRIQVVGGGCSGYSYRMGFDKSWNEDTDHVFRFDDLQVFVDRASLLHIEGTEVDYVEGLHGSGFKFNNPNVTGSCGCGQSFST
jgi:iron-sulfur cluster assembly accessory protein